MQKGKQYNVEGSNIAQLGTAAEAAVRQATGAGEPAWKAAGKAVGLEIWRIEKFKVVPVARAEYGTFYSGDSYIVLHTYNKRPGSPALAWDVHFWLGAQTSQDEAGTAAYKTVELDDFLGTAPVQHREIQDWESPLFLSYFPGGVRILEGGIESGFNHVAPKDYRPRLLQLKGKRNIRLREVPCALASVNSGDVFVLDLGLKLVQFNGAQSGALERAKAAEVCRAIDSERSGKPEVLVFEEQDTTYPKEWTDILGTGAIASAGAGGSDLAFEAQPSGRLLFRLSDASGTLTVTKVAEDAAVTRDKLDPADVFIVDVGNEIFAWIGAGASKDERRMGIHYAEDYLRKAGRPMATPISRVLDGAESDYFLKLLS